MAITQIRGANNSVGTSQIKAGTISNADIHASAAIASTKLATFTANRDAGSFKIINLLDPTAAQDAATKYYVDSVITGTNLSWKNAVLAATTANITLSGTQTVDGISLVATNRVLVKDQTASENNGIYLVAAGAWTRATDMDAAAEFSSAAVFVQTGTVNADRLYVETAEVVTLGTDPVTWVQFSAVQDLVAGAGLTKTSLTIDVVAGDTSLLVNANDLVVQYASSNPLLETAGGGVRIAATAAGNGLTGGGGSALAVGTANTGIAINANDIALFLNATFSGLEISTGLRLATTAAGSGLDGGGTAALSVSMTQEVPASGAINGSNTAFTTTNPIHTGSLLVFLNGQYQKGGGDDYTLASQTVTFTNAPQTGDSIMFWYLNA